MLLVLKYSRRVIGVKRRKLHFTLFTPREIIILLLFPLPQVFKHMQYHPEDSQQFSHSQYIFLIIFYQQFYWLLPFFGFFQSVNEAAIDFCTLVHHPSHQPLPHRDASLS